jgi:hypothetical protein
MDNKNRFIHIFTKKEKDNICISFQDNAGSKIKELRNCNPSLLFKIGKSYVGGVQFDNFLRVEVDDPIMITTTFLFILRSCSTMTGPITLPEPPPAECTTTFRLLDGLN